MKSNILIQNLIFQAKDILSQIQTLISLHDSVLKWKKNPTSWSVLECVAHLNLYADFYLPSITSKIKIFDADSESDFKSGILGNYFAQLMLPKEKLNKMKTFNDKNPLNKALDKKVLAEFILKQNLMLEILAQSSNLNLNKIKISTSISRLIKLNLGDTFQFLINHQIRHLKQIKNVLETQNSNN